MNDKNIKYVAIANTIIKSIGCICVLLATYITKNPDCLWALILVYLLGMNYNSSDNKENQL